jgi:hypothetical protein
LIIDEKLPKSKVSRAKRKFGLRNANDASSKVENGSIPKLDFYLDDFDKDVSLVSPDWNEPLVNILL